MPAVKCRCGSFIDIGAFPSPGEYLLISDVDYDAFSGTVDAEALFSKFHHMLACDDCNRLLVFWRGFGQPPTFYSKEDGVP